MLENLPCAVHQSPFHRILQYLICAQSSGFLVDAAQADFCCAREFISSVQGYINQEMRVWLFSRIADSLCFT